MDDKPSKGDEAIALIENLEKEKEKESIIQAAKDEENAHEALLVPPEILTPYVQAGVEVIDAKAVPKKRTKPEIDKHGIPIRPGERRNFDRI